MTIAARLDICIRENEAANVDRAARFALDALSDRLRKYRCTWSKLHPDERARYFGINWHGPAVDDLIRQSERLCAAETIEIRRVA